MLLTKSSPNNVPVSLTIFQAPSINTIKDIIWEGISENCFLLEFQTLWWMAPSRLITV